MKIQMEKSKDRVMLSEGSHVAVLVGLVDLGTQETFYGPKKQIGFLFEFPNKKHTFKEDDGPVSLSRSVIVTSSLNQKSTLCKYVVAIKGKQLAKSEMESGIDLSELLGRATLATIVHRPGKDEQVYDNITGLSIMPEGLPCGEVTSDPFVFEISADLKNWDRVPEWMQKKIAESPEYKSAKGNGHVVENTEDSPF
jgi:hypothetical protein